MLFEFGFPLLMAVGKALSVMVVSVGDWDAGSVLAPDSVVLPPA